MKYKINLILSLFSKSTSLLLIFFIFLFALKLKIPLFDNAKKFKSLFNNIDTNIDYIFLEVDKHNQISLHFHIFYALYYHQKIKHLLHILL